MNCESRGEIDLELVFKKEVSKFTPSDFTQAYAHMSVTIQVNTLTGKKIFVQCMDYETISQVKAKIQDREGIPPDQQRLSVARLGKPLRDELTLADYGFSTRSEFDLSLRRTDAEINRPQPVPNVNVNQLKLKEQGDKVSFKIEEREIQDKNGDKSTLITLKLQNWNNNNSGNSSGDAQIAVTGNKNIFVGSIKQAFVDAGSGENVSTAQVFKSCFSNITCISQIGLYFQEALYLNDIDFLSVLNKSKRKQLQKKNKYKNSKNMNNDTLVIRKETDFQYQGMIKTILESIMVNNSNDNDNINDDEKYYSIEECQQSIMTCNFQNYTPAMKRLFGENNSLFNKQWAKSNYKYDLDENLKSYFFDDVVKQKRDLENRIVSFKTRINQLKTEMNKLEKNLDEEKDFNDKLSNKIECKPSYLNKLNSNQLFKLQELYQQNLGRITNAIKSNAKDGKLCIICYDRSKNVLFQPCGHFHTCQQCSNQIRKCPMCNVRITQKINVFQ